MFQEDSKLNYPQLLRDLDVREQESLRAGQDNSIGNDSFNFRETTTSNEAKNQTNFPDGSSTIQTTKYTFSRISLRFSMKFSLPGFEINKNISHNFLSSFCKMWFS